MSDTVETYPWPVVYDGAWLPLRDVYKSGFITTAQGKPASLSSVKRYATLALVAGDKDFLHLGDKCMVKRHTDGHRRVLIHRAALPWRAPDHRFTLTVQDRQDIHRMHRAGSGITAIAAEFGVSYGRVWQMVKGGE